MTLDIFSAIKPEPWMKEGVCADYLQPDMWWDASDFFPSRGYSATSRRAIEICRTCPVMAECAQYALDNDERSGIWGGLTPDVRRVMRGRKRREGAA